MAFLSSLNREQKEAIGLLQIGTFLEYFDLMLYIHMAVLLNELFFPQTDPHTAALLAAFAFCSTFILRPFGALIFGYIGDTIGRKSTVIITTLMMSMSCIIMATLPTYAQIGIIATWVITLCRITQGLSSMGEVMGAQIYITEITKPPAQYPAVALIILASGVGSMVALGVASLVTHLSLNWRIAFWIGAAIAVVGSVARTRLRETPEFVDMKRKKKIEIEKYCKDEKRKKELLEKMGEKINGTKVPKKDFAAYFFIQCSSPFFFYLTFIYFNPLLKSFGYSSTDIIFHNFLLSIIDLFGAVILIYLVTIFHPLKILKLQTKYFLCYILILPMLVTQSTSVWQLFFLQGLLLTAPAGGIPAQAIFIKSFNVAKRFTATTFAYATARSCIHIIAAFGLVYLTEWFGFFGIWIVSLPIIGAFFWAIRHFEKLEGLRPNRSGSKPRDEAMSNHAA